jgi:hypothetical protein
MVYARLIVMTFNLCMHAVCGRVLLRYQLVEFARAEACATPFMHDTPSCYHLPDALIITSESPTRARCDHDCVALCYATVRFAFVCLAKVLLLALLSGIFRLVALSCSSVSTDLNNSPEPGIDLQQVLRD